MANLFSNSYTDFSYWFSNTIIDNNGENVSDINAGIEKLLPDMIDQLNNANNDHTRFIVPDCQIAMPDIAAQTFYKYESLWWYICLANLLDNPFNQYTNQYLFYAFTLQILESHDIKQQKSSTQQKSKIGTIIELN